MGSIWVARATAARCFLRGYKKAPPKKVGLFYCNSQMARSGKIDTDLLNMLNQLNYYKLPYPKSLGYEWFISDMLPLIDNSDIAIVDKLATVVEHEVIQIANSLKDNINMAGEVLVTGGGAFNTYFVERLKYYLPEQLQIIIPDKPIIEFKEALIFAFMGVLRLRNEDNCLKSVTGASENCSGGVFFKPV